MPSIAANDESWRTRLLHWAAIFLVFYTAMLITIPWLPMGDSMETFNILTGVEIAREGNWILPTMWRLPRLEKPPLSQWLSASGILLGGPIEVSARWIGMLLTCLTLIVAYEWARLWGSWRAGLIAALVAGSTLFFLRFGKRSSYDAHLMVWVALTNYALTRLMFREGKIRWAVAGGVALGGALLTKGFPALLHTVVPFVVCLGGLSFYRKQTAACCPKLWPVTGKFALALSIGLAIGGIYILTLTLELGGYQRMFAQWRNELIRAEETNAGMWTSPLAGTVFFALLLPWTHWLIGVVRSARRNWNEQGVRTVYLLIFILLPVVVHSFIPPMRDRYLLPMMVPAAVAIALVLEDLLSRPKLHGLDRLGIATQYLIVAAIGIGYPLTLLRGDKDTPALPWPMAAFVAGIAGAVLLTGLLRQRKIRWAFLPATLGVMLVFQALYTFQQGAGPDYAKDIAREINQRWPERTLYTYRVRGIPRELGIHLGRPVQGIRSIKEIPPGTVALVLMRDVLLEEMPPGSREIASFPTERRPVEVWELP